jgi:transposase
MFPPHPPLSPEVLDRLNRAVAEEIAKSQPKFYELEKYREFIKAHVEARTQQKVIIRSLKNAEGVNVSPDTFSRYVRAAGFRPDKPTRRKRREPSV